MALVASDRVEDLEGQSTARVLEPHECALSFVVGLQSQWALCCVDEHSVIGRFAVLFVGSFGGLRAAETQWACWEVSVVASACARAYGSDDSETLIRSVHGSSSRTCFSLCVCNNVKWLVESSTSRLPDPRLLSHDIALRSH